MWYLFYSFKILFLLLLYRIAYAQEEPTLSAKDFSQEKVLSWLEIGGGANAYRGDLNTQMRFWQPTLQISLQLNRKRQWNGKFTFISASIRAENPLYEYPLPENPPATPNTYFETNFFSLQYELHYNIIKKRDFIWFISQGIGFLRFRIQDLEGRDLTQITSTRKVGETYSTNVLTLPTGIGFLYNFTNGFGFLAQTTLYNLRTDYIDNIKAWGTLPQNDNVLALKLGFLIPLYKQPLRQLHVQNEHTH
ncbi:MAG: hypothetical protein NZ551_00145 [Microscillaceae bacterium]|nr:hypothetical protein [Microscillaceae bacterium]MDW8459599.1 hypothetical protein [Cytophagales bacterium]